MGLSKRSSQTAEPTLLSIKLSFIGTSKIRLTTSAGTRFGPSATGLPTSRQDERDRLKNIQGVRYPGAG